MGVAMECVREDPAGATLAPPPQPRNEAGRQTSRNLTLPAAASQSAYRFARLNAALRRHGCSSVQTKEGRGNIQAVEAAAVKRKLLRRSLSRCQQMPDGYMFSDGNRDAFLEVEMVAEGGSLNFTGGPSGVTSASPRSELLQHFRQPSCSGSLGVHVPNLLPSWIGPFFAGGRGRVSVHLSPPTPPAFSSPPRRQISPTTHRTVDGITTRWNRRVDTLTRQPSRSQRSPLPRRGAAGLFGCRASFRV